MAGATELVQLAGGDLDKSRYLTLHLDGNLLGGGLSVIQITQAESVYLEITGGLPQLTLFSLADGGQSRPRRGPLPVPIRPGRRGVGAIGGDRPQLLHERFRRHDAGLPRRLDRDSAALLTNNHFPAMRYIILKSTPAANHTEDSTGTPCLIHRVADNVTISGPALVVQSLAGYTPLNGFSFDKPKPVPASTANWRAKAVLTMAGLLPAVEAALDALDEPQRTVALAAWNSNADLARNGPTVLALAPVLGLTDAQVDDMFRQAAALQV